MGKREEVKKPRRTKDFYATIDPDAIPEALIERVRGKTYAEPCYGNGDLEDLLMEVAICKWRSDIRRTVKSSMMFDALRIQKEHLVGIDYIITNPPYQWDMLEPLLNHLPNLKSTWFLLPADMMHNKRMGPHMRRCSWVISVGRLYWMDNKIKGVDNYAWYEFRSSRDYDTRFIGR